MHSESYRLVNELIQNGCCDGANPTNCALKWKLAFVLCFVVRARLYFFSMDKQQLSLPLRINIIRHFCFLHGIYLIGRKQIRI